MTVPTKTTFTDKSASAGSASSAPAVFAASDANELKTSVNEAIDYLSADRVEIGTGSNAGTDRNTVVIGKNADGSNTSAISSVVIGDSAEGSLPRSVTIGLNASSVLDATFGGAVGDEAVAIGNGSKSYAWRAVAIGGNSHAADTSSTAIGAGAVTEVSHGVTLGRGATLLDYTGLTGGGDAPTSVLGASTNSADVHVYFSNTWANNFDTPISGISIGSTPVPSSWEVAIHGRDAWDSRASPSETNVAAGHLGLHGGIGTGTGIGGDVLMYSYPASGSSNNTKNTKVLAAKIDAAASVDTRFLLLDVTDSTVKRVEFGADDSGGSGYKMLRVAN